MEETDVRELGEDFRFISSVRTLFPAIKKNQISTSVNLIASSSRFGLVFTAFGSEVKVYHSNDVIDDNVPTSFGDFSVPGIITHLAINCDNFTLLAAGTNLNGLLFGFFYDIRIFAIKSPTYNYYYAAPLSAYLSACIESICWNPTDPGSVAVAINTGEISLIQLKDGSVSYTTTLIGASCVTWSAKGKQLAVGTRKGTVELFKTDLTPVRIVQPPSIDELEQVVSINWFSNTEFFVGYRKKGVLVMFVVTAPKTGAASYIDMDDICYSGDKSNRPHSYYSLYIPEWSLLFALSSHSSDLAILGKSESNPNSWSQWIPEEGFRASLQFINVVEETFPLGLCPVFCSRKIFNMKDGAAKGPFVAFLSLTTGGQINIFHVENKISGGPSLTILAEPIPATGARTNEQYGITVVENSPAAPSELPTQNVSVDNTSIIASTPVKPPGSSPLLHSVSQVSSSFSFGQPVAPGKTTGFSIAPQCSTPKGLPRQTFEAISPTPLRQSAFQITPSATNSSFGVQLDKANPNFASPNTFAGLQSNTNLAVSSPILSQSLLSNSNVVSPSALPKSAPIKSPIITPSALAGQPFHTPSNIVTPTNIVTPNPRTGVILPTTPIPKTQQNEPPAVAHLPQDRAHSNSAPVANPIESAGRQLPPTSDIPKRVKAKLMQHITDELVNFENELMSHGKTNTLTCLDVGSDEDKKGISNLVTGLDSWVEDTRAIVNEQNAKISTLHEGALENCALYEDATAQSHSNKSVRKQTFVQLRPLDPYSRRKLDEIRSKYQYLRSQISEVNAKLDSEWRNYNNANHKKSKEYAGGSSEMVHRSSLNLRKMRQSVESKLNKLCTLMRCQNLGSFLLPPDAANDSLKTANGVNSPAGKMSLKNMQNLQRVLSERKHTPVRTFSTPKSSMSIDGRDLLITNAEESFISEASHELNPLIALKSFVGKTTPTKQIDLTDTLRRAAIEAPLNSPLLNPAFMAGPDAALLQQYTMAMMNQMSGNIPMHQALVNNALAGICTQPGINSMGVVPPISSISPIVSGSSSKPALFGGSILTSGSMFQQPRLDSASPMFATSKLETNAAPLGVNLAHTPTALQQHNAAKLFSLPNQSTILQSTPNISVKPSMILEGAGQPSIVASPITCSPRIMGQSEFNFNTTLSSTSTDNTHQSDLHTFNTLNSKSDHYVPPPSNSSGSSGSIIPGTSIFTVPAGKEQVIDPVSKLKSLPSISVFSASPQIQTDATKLLFGSKPSESSANAVVTSQTSQFGTSLYSSSAFGQKANFAMSSTFGAGTNASVEKSVPETGPAISSSVDLPVTNIVTGGLNGVGVSTVTNETKFQGSAVSTVQSSGTVGCGTGSTQLPVANFGNSSLAKSVPSFSFGSAIRAPTTGLTTVKSEMGSDMCTSATLPLSSHKEETKPSSTKFGTVPTASALSIPVLSKSSVPTTDANIIASPETSSSTEFGSQVTSPQTTNFGGDSTTPGSSIFAPSVTPQIFGSGGITTTTPSVFGGAITTPVSTAFGNSVTTSVPNIFGNSASAPISGTFGNATVVAPTSSTFGNNTVTPNSANFGGAAATSSAFGGTVAAPNAGIFGGNVVNSSAPISAGFGNVATTSSSSIFGGSMTTSNSSIFGGTVAASSSSGFGNNPTNAGGSIFGGSTSTPSIFGNGGSSTSSIFGGTTSSTPSNIFGGSSATGVNTFANQASSAFGNTPVSGSGAFNMSSVKSTDNKLFAADSNSIFGGNTQNCRTTPFGSTTGANSSCFGKPMQSEGGFGSTDMSGSAFGAANSSSSAFGSQGGSVFGGSAAVTPAFGSSVFANNATPTSQSQSAFALLKTCSGLGGSPDPATASQNVFGSVAPVNANTDLFKPQPGQPSNSPFAAAKTPSAFGGTSSFGSAPAFGSAPNFGGSAFSGGSAFGATTPAPGQAASPGFQNGSKSVFTNQENNSTFGSLAQQQNNESFGEKSFGGNAFSSWR